MNKIEELKLKFEKSEQRVEKGKKTIERHKNQLQKKVDKIAMIGLNLENNDLSDLSAYKWHDDYKEYYWEFCDIESKQDDIIRATKKLKESERILLNWKEKLEKAKREDELLENEVPIVIKEYLNNWKSLAYNWYLNRYNEYKKYVDENGITYKNLKQRQTLFGNIIIEMDSKFIEEEREKWLDTLLEQEKKNKILDLMIRTKEVVGQIKNADCLTIGLDGHLNGIIEGEKGKAKVQTIDAGGYNIQCYHFRVLVKKID